METLMTPDKRLTRIRALHAQPAPRDGGGYEFISARRTDRTAPPFAFVEGQPEGAMSAG